MKNFISACIVSLGLIVFLAIATIIFARADGADVKALLRKTSVIIQGKNYHASGSIVEGASGRKYLLTNAHVCSCAKYTDILIADPVRGSRMYATIVKQDYSSDLCAAKVDDRRKALFLGLEAPESSEVNTLGYPSKVLTEGHGHIQGINTWDYTFDMKNIGECPINGHKNGDSCTIRFKSTQTNLFARPGSSGSPVVNDEGELVGVISSFRATNYFDAGMVPLDQIRSFMDSL